ncbi:MAG: alkaline phosphatase family protein [Akkermansiaceae bacterium]|nr:alkaline phosphatase family protein [Akkermansiaceae bacterium]
MKRVAVLDVVGLTRGLLGERTPRLAEFAGRGEVASFKPAFPAVTCTAQASYLTGRGPAWTGIVGNGWYDREAAEVKFWKQSNHLVKGEKLWERVRRERPGFTCAKLFWWYNMYSSADLAITPRPLYLADGGKVFDVHTHPLEMRDAIKRDLGAFPFPEFWGPMAGIGSSRWIADAAKWIEDRHEPGLNLVYLPHLDYCLQKSGPGAPEVDAELAAIDAVAGDLIAHLERKGVEVVVVSEYGISAVSRPVHLNRIFRKRGWLRIKEELGRETLDCGTCQAFAVADHQVAHVYVNDDAIRGEVRAVLEETEGVEEVREGTLGERAGDFVAVAEPDAWFTYYYWDDDQRAPDFARTVDIHRKPGYDPAELFIDPGLCCPRLKMAQFLMKKKLGMRGLLEVIPLDASLVRGSHGRDAVPEDEQPVVIGTGAAGVHSAEAVFDYLLGRCMS